MSYKHYPTMSRELAAVYTQMYGLALDTALVEFSDPASIPHEALLANVCKLRRLRATLLPALQRQNAVDCTALSLELEHLLVNIHERLERLVVLLTCESDASAHFSKLHLWGTCKRHAKTYVNFYGGCQAPVQLSIINDVETFFKRLNSVFYCTSADNALDVMNTVMGFLGELRGASPIPPPDAYSLCSACMRCVDEVAALPNRGESMPALLLQASCPHICRPVGGEPVMHLFENELELLGIHEHSHSHSADTSRNDNVPKGNTEQHGTSNLHTYGKSGVHLLEASLAGLSGHNIFGDVPESIRELSNLVYWNAGQVRRGAGRSMDRSRLAELLEHEERMHAARAQIPQVLHMPARVHFFDLHRPMPLEALFCGGVFNSVHDTIAALKDDCAAAFANQPNYRDVLKRQNELFVRLSNVLHGNGSNEEEVAKTQFKSGTNGIERGALNLQMGNEQRNMTEDHVHADANARRDAYLQKLASDGMAKLCACLDKQSGVLVDTLTMRVWGDTVYCEAAILKNHFMRRRALAYGPWECSDTNDSHAMAAQFENSKHIKNGMYVESLSREHVEALMLNFYELITGPLARNRGLFPLPANVTLAHCMDAAGAMPHQKMLVAELIWPSIEPRDWIDERFNRFFEVCAPDLGGAQREAWTYVREAVLSVALYNRTWEKQLQLYPADAVRVGNAPSDGAYLTYESNAPLVLVHGGEGWVFKDLYAMLYQHLQLTGSKANRQLP
uniref:Subunit of terminase n=1 Tax=Otarine gammaherpesvirus 4 TaxID=2801541 RepID=A0A889IWH8_9GAMA|nr:Subunit of terminase [Otarine gammaherpesvirus 4]